MPSFEGRMSNFLDLPLDEHHKSPYFYLWFEYMMSNPKTVVILESFNPLSCFAVSWTWNLVAPLQVISNITSIVPFARTHRLDSTNSSFSWMHKALRLDFVAAAPPRPKFYVRGLFLWFHILKVHIGGAVGGLVRGERAGRGRKESESGCRNAGYSKQSDYIN